MAEYRVTYVSALTGRTEVLITTDDLLIAEQLVTRLGEQGIALDSWVAYGFR